MKATVEVSPLESGRWMAVIVINGERRAGGLHATQPTAVAGGCDYACCLAGVTEIEVVTKAPEQP